MRRRRRNEARLDVTVFRQAAQTVHLLRSFSDIVMSTTTYSIAQDFHDDTSNNHFGACFNYFGDLETLYCLQLYKHSIVFTFLNTIVFTFINTLLPLPFLTLYCLHLHWQYLAFTFTNTLLPSPLFGTPLSSPLLTLYCLHLYLALYCLYLYFTFIYTQLTLHFFTFIDTIAFTFTDTLLPSPLLTLTFTLMWYSIVFTFIDILLPLPLFGALLPLSLFDIHCLHLYWHSIALTFIDTLLPSPLFGTGTGVKEAFFRDPQNLLQQVDSKRQTPYLRRFQRKSGTRLRTVERSPRQTRN